MSSSFKIHLLNEIFSCFINVEIIYKIKTSVGLKQDSKSSLNSPVYNYKDSLMSVPSLPTAETLRHLNKEQLSINCFTLFKYKLVI